MTFTNEVTRIKSFNLFNTFLTSKSFVLFGVPFLLRLDNLTSKSVFVMKLACASLVLKISATKVLNSGVIIYLSWLWSVRFFPISVIFVLVCFF